jgi:hypothetical protein
MPGFIDLMAFLYRRCTVAPVAAAPVYRVEARDLFTTGQVAGANDAT